MNKTLLTNTYDTIPEKPLYDPRIKTVYDPLILVNRSHALKNAFKTPGGLMDVSDFMPVMAGEKVLLLPEAWTALKALLKDIAAGTEITAVSGWRSFNEQVQIYRSSLEENGEDFTRKYVAWPGCSEHETGLAIDLGQTMDEMDFIRPAFPYDGICGRFRALAPDYGFILRYPKEKEAITGISEEPWHFRYVGVPHARRIANEGLCLEEYVEVLKKYQ